MYGVTLSELAHVLLLAGLRREVLITRRAIGVTWQGWLMRCSCSESCSRDCSLSR